MARSRLCRTCKGFHDLDQPWPPTCASHFGSVSANAGFHIISDNIEPFRSMADGKVYTSKSLYRGDLKARGMIEVGNERVTQRRAEAPPIRDTLRRTMQQLGG